MKFQRAKLLLIMTVAGLLCWQWFIAPFSLRSAEQTPTVPSSEVKDTSFIPVTEIIARSTEVRGSLREFEKNVSDKGLEEKMERFLSVIEPEITSEKLKFESAVSVGINAVELRGMKRSWAGLRDELTLQEQIIGERITKVQAWLSDVRNQNGLWKRTKKEAGRISASSTVHREVDVTLKALETTENKLRKGRDTALDLQSRIRHHLDSVGTVLSRIRDQLDIRRRSLFARQDSPVWKMRIGPDEIIGEMKGLAKMLRHESTVVLKYMERHIGLIIVRILLVAMVVWLVRWTGDVLKKQPGAGNVSDEDDDTVTSPLEGPANTLAGGILLGLTLNLIIYFDSPMVFQLVIVVLILPLWLYMLESLQPLAQKTFHAGFAVLVVLQLVLSYAEQYPFLSRLLVFVESGLGLMLVRRIRRSVLYQRSGQLMKENIWFRVVDVWLKVICATFIVAVGASLLGYRSLAITLEGLAILGTFIGSLFLCAVRIIEDIVQAIVDAGKLNSLRMIRIQPERFLKVTSRGLRAFAFFAWIYFVLDSITLWDPFWESVTGILAARFGYGALSLSLGGLIAFGLTLWISWLLSRFIPYVLDREVFMRLRMPPGIPFALTSFSRYTILVIGVLIALATLGISLDRLALLISALGVGIGFGLQNVVNNFVSGVILLFERPIRVGDMVQLDTLMGTVTDIGIRASNVRSFDGADVIVPNGDFISARVINWTLSDRKRRIILPVGVTYGTDPTKVLEILESVARSHVEVLVDPPPQVLFRGFGDSSLDFEMRTWTDSERGWPAIMSDLAVATYDALTEADIEIPFPQRDLHLKSVDEDVRDILSGEKKDQIKEKQDEESEIHGDENDKEKQ